MPLAQYLSTQFTRLTALLLVGSSCRWRRMTTELMEQGIYLKSTGDGQQGAVTGISWTSLVSKERRCKLATICCCVTRLHRTSLTTQPRVSFVRQLFATMDFLPARSWPIDTFVWFAFSTQPPYQSRTLAVVPSQGRESHQFRFNVVQRFCPRRRILCCLQLHRAVAARWACLKSKRECFVSPSTWSMARAINYRLHAAYCTVPAIAVVGGDEDKQEVSFSPESQLAVSALGSVTGPGPEHHRTLSPAPLDPGRWKCEK